MLQIGDFSKVSRVSIKTLRYYDSIGLLSPDEVNPVNGYRFYKPQKLIELSEIHQLKEIGLSLEMIKTIRSENPASDEIISILSDQKGNLENELSTTKKRILDIESMIQVIKEGVPMETVTIKNLPEVTVASYRLTIPNYDALYEVAPKMGKIMTKAGAVCSEPPYCFNIYHDDEYRETDIDIEICEAVVEACKDGDDIVYKVINSIETAACINHKGNYDTLGASYGEIFRWIEENGYTVSDHARESFIDGIWNKEDPRDWLTEIQIPVKK